MNTIELIIYLWAILAGAALFFGILAGLEIIIFKMLDHPNPNKLRKYHIMRRK